MGKTGNALAVQELNFQQGRLGLGKGFDPYQNLKSVGGLLGGGNTEDENALRAKLFASINSGGNPDIHSAIAGLFGLQKSVAGQPALAELDPATKASLDQITKANLEKFSLNQQNEHISLLNDLFGSGTEKSTIALDKAGRAQYGQGALLEQLLADAAQRELGTRSDISNRALQSAGLQANIFNQAGGLAENEQAQRQQLLESLMQTGLSRTGLAANLDVSRQNQAQDFATRIAQFQSQRVSPVGSILSGALGLASFALPGGGTIGGALLGKIPGLNNIFKGPGALPFGTGSSGPNSAGT